MNLNRYLPRKVVWGGLFLGLVMAEFTPRAQANVYPTNIRINSGTTNVVTAAGESINISFILNEPASLGTTIQILSGNSVVTNLFLQPQTQGTLRGLNEITWDAPLSDGTYSVSITAASSGYTNWTQITSDTTDPNTYVFDGRGIAVDPNPTSPYYGRVFLANSSPGFGVTPGDTVGILKLNADTSDAEEGVSSADFDGHLWTDNEVSPWKLEVSADDYVYVDDLANGGELFRWDPTISSNSLLYVLRTDNQPPGAALSGPAIVGSGAATQIWMANTNAAAIYSWALTAASVCATNDTGKLMVRDAATNLFDVALDKSGNIYACARVIATNDPAPRVFRYSAGGGNLQSNSVWAVGASDDTYAGASGVAVDPTGTYLAATFEGPGNTITTNGNIKILWATNGAVAANLDLGVQMQGDDNHDDTDCAWDAVGNVYYIDAYFSRWRSFSPPGTNQATTFAISKLQVGNGPPPPPSGTVQITKLSVAGGNVNIDFTAGTNDTISAFTILGAAAVTGPFTTVTAANITQVGPGLFHAVFPLGPATQYFKISRQGSAPPPGLAFTKISSSGSNIVLTFSGNASDPASAFTVMSSATANGTYSAATNANVSLLSPGVFQAVVPASGPLQFYRIRR